MPRKLIAVNAIGRRIGEDNPNAKVTNHDVDLMFQLSEEAGLGCRVLGKKFDLSRMQVRRILRGKQRQQVADHFKSVK